MSESDVENTWVKSTTTGPIRYERPVLTPIGNARDILAGGFGSVDDAPDIEPTRTSG